MTDQDLIGQNYAAARVRLIAKGIKHRVWKIDGELRLLTRDFNPERLNFEVKDGIIIEVHIG